jgi:chromate transporter
MLFSMFFRIGLFSFGGGYTMISLLQFEMVEAQIMSTQQFLDMVAISQITPGPLAINMATFVGFYHQGILGALVATFAVSLPSLIIMITVTSFIVKIKGNKNIEIIFLGLRPAVAGLMFMALITLAHQNFFAHDFHYINYKGFFLTLASILIMYKYKLSPFYIIILCFLGGVIIF